MVIVDRPMHKVGDQPITGIKITDRVLLAELGVIRNNEGIADIPTAVKKLVDAYFEAHPDVRRPATSPRKIRPIAREIRH